MLIPVCVCLYRVCTLRDKKSLSGLSSATLHLVFCFFLDLGLDSVAGLAGQQAQGTSPPLTGTVGLNNTQLFM